MYVFYHTEPLRIRVNEPHRYSPHRAAPTHRPCGRSILDTLLLEDCLAVWTKFQRYYMNYEFSSIFNKFPGEC